MKIDIGALEKHERLSKIQNIGTSRFQYKKIGDKHKLEFYRQFSVLLEAGVDFSSALAILKEQQESIRMKDFYENIYMKVTKGKTLFESIENHGSFSDYESYSIKIGEETRRLPQILKELEKFFDRKIKLKRQIISVVTYPTFVLTITIAVLYFMLNYVVPMFESVFQQFGRELPQITRLVINISEKFNSIALGAVIFVFAAILIHKRLLLNTSYQEYYAQALLRIPFFGKIIKKIYIARFCQSMSLLLSAKTSLITTIELTGRMIGFYPIQKAMMEVKQNILKGHSLQESLAVHSIFPQKIIALTRTGEHINKLDEIYENLSHQYDMEVEHSTKVMGTVIEPIMILIIGGIVGFIMVALYSPIFNLSKILEH